MKTNQLKLALALCFVSLPAIAASPVEDRLREAYAAGASSADVVRGAMLWRQQQADRACTSCHGDVPSASGRHVKTGKAIEPMAPSVNRQRYADAGKTDKWFRRNCKWTFGRECSAQEKADILAWLAQQ